MRFSTPSLANVVPSVFMTVRSEMPSLVAICGFVSPSLTNARISSCRGLSALGVFTSQRYQRVTRYVNPQYG